MEQGTEEWFTARIGKVTASRIADVMAKGKGTAEAATRKKYRIQLAAERLSGEKAEGFTSSAMQWGIDQEENARRAYEFEKSVTVEQVGFIDHPHLAMSGASPDGLIGEDGMLEIKCPDTSTHVEFMDSGEIQRKYLLQMQWQMACTGRKWCDFVSYDPRLPIEYQLAVKRVERDEETIRCIWAAVDRLLNEVQETIDNLGKWAV